jgi:hypothetical protein
MEALIPHLLMFIIAFLVWQEHGYALASRILHVQVFPIHLCLQPSQDQFPLILLSHYRFPVRIYQHFPTLQHLYSHILYHNDNKNSVSLATNTVSCVPLGAIVAAQGTHVKCV